MAFVIAFALAFGRVCVVGRGLRTGVGVPNFNGHWNCIMRAAMWNYSACRDMAASFCGAAWCRLKLTGLYASVDDWVA